MLRLCVVLAAVMSTGGEMVSWSKGGFTITGEVTGSGDPNDPCSSTKTGTVTLSLNEPMYSLDVLATKSRNCVAGGPELWTFSGSSETDIIQYDTKMTSVGVTLKEMQNDTWDGVVNGTVALDAGAVLGGKISFGEDGFKTYGVDGLVSMGPVSGMVDLSVMPSSVIEGSINASLSPASGPVIDDILGHLVYNASGADSKYTINGACDTITALSLSLNNVSLSLTGDGSDWSGSASGATSLEDFSLLLTAAFSENTFQNLSGTIATSHAEFMFSGSAEFYKHNESTPLALSGSGDLSIYKPTAIAFNISTVFRGVDPKTSEVNWAFSGNLASPVTLFEGFTISGGSIDLSKHASGTWDGNISTTTTLFSDHVLDVSASISDGALVAIAVDLDNSGNGTGVNIAGTINYSTTTACTNDTRGSVEVGVPALGNLVAQGSLAQKNGCGSNNKPLWALAASADASTISGFSITDVALELESYSAGASTAWNGSLQGTMTIASIGAEAKVDVAFDTGRNPKLVSFIGSLNISAPPVAAYVQAEVTGDSQFTASGMLDVDGVLKGLETTVDYDGRANATYVVDAKGKMAEWELGPLTIRDVDVALLMARANGKKVWSGSASGSLAVLGLAVNASAAFVENKFNVFTGDFAFNRGALDFTGNCSVNMTAQACPTVDAHGSLVATVGATKPEITAVVAYDKCGDSKLAITGSLDSPLTIFSGLTLESGSIDVAAPVVNGTISSAFDGAFSATLNLFGLETSATMQYVDGKFDTISAQLQYNKNGIALTGTLDFSTSETCTPRNNGSVVISVPSVGVAVTGYMMQQDACNAKGEPLWDVGAELTEPLTIYSLTVSDAKLALSMTQAKPATWVGSFDGALEFGSPSNTASVNVALDTSKSPIVTKVSGELDLSLPPVTGSLRFAAAPNGLIEGNGTFAVGSVLSGMKASVAYMKAAIAPSPVWVVRGSLDQFQVSALTITGVTVEMNAVRQVGQLVWGGSMNGSASIHGLEIIASATFVDNAFSTFTGEIVLVRPGVKFTAGVTITALGGSCQTVDANGQLLLLSLSGNPSFTATLAYESCGAEEYAISGHNNGQIKVFEGLVLDEVALNIRAPVVQGKLSNSFSGTATASVYLFDVKLSAGLVLSDGAIDSVTVSLDYNKHGLRVSGDVAFFPSQPCNSANTGEVSLEISSLGIIADGALSQKDGCAADGKSPLYTITAQVTSDVTILGVSVSNVEVRLESRKQNGVTAWNGTVSGTVVIGQSTLNAVVAFDQIAGVQRFTLDGKLVIGPFSGDVEVDVQNGRMTGNALFTLSAAGSTLPSFEASFERIFVKAPGSSEPDFKINGKLNSWSYAGFSLDSVTVDATGNAPAEGAALDWDIAVNGKATIGDAAAQVAIEIEKVDGAFAFQELVAQVVIKKGIVDFAGTMIVQRDEPQCGVLAITGALQLSKPKASFSASIDYDRCASSVGQTVYTITGSMAAPMLLDDLELRNVLLDMTGKRAAGNALSWSGTVTADAAIFGAGVKATVAFADGAVEKAILDVHFVTPNMLLEGDIKLLYSPDKQCRKLVSTGNGQFKLRLKGADDLTFTGSVAYTKCTGRLELTGQIGGSWNGPAGTKVNGMSVTLIKHENEGGVTQLKKGRWTGYVNATSAAGLSASVEWDTRSSVSSVTGYLSYDSPKLELDAYISTNCVGGGYMTVSPGRNIQDITTSFSFSKPCERGPDGKVVPTKEWDVVATLHSPIVIPFPGKPLRITEITVKVSQDRLGKKTVSISGTLFNDFLMSIEFSIPFSTLEIKAVLKTGGKPSPGGFSKNFGASPSAGASPTAIFNPLNNLNLRDVQLAFSFENKRITLSANGNAFGMDFVVGIAVENKNNVWSFGALFKTQNTGGGSLPGALKALFGSMKPDYVSLSIATRSMSIAGVNVDKGLMLQLALGSKSPFGSQKLKMPAAFSSQARGASSGGHLIVSATLVSITSIDVKVSFAGNIRMGSRASIKALQLVIKIGTGPPEVGFAIVIGFTLGQAPNTKYLQIAGYMGFDATGSLSLALEVAGDPWVRPFGLRGITIEFPIFVSLTISPSLVPTAFSFHAGGLKIGQARGSVTFGADLTDLSKVGFAVSLTNFKFNQILTDVAGCHACGSGVLAKLTDVSVRSVSASFNPNPLRPMIIQGITTSVEIPAGIKFEILDLRMWNLIRVRRAALSVDANGFEAELQADAFNLGPVRFTSTRSSSLGPSFKMVLTKSKRLLRVDAKATILGASVSLYLELKDRSVIGFFVLKIWIFTVDVQLSVIGRPGQSGFRQTISASLSTRALSGLIDKATAFLYDAKRAADAKFNDAKRKVDSAKRTLQSKKDALERKRREVVGKVDRAQRSVNNWAKKIGDKYRQCKSKDKECKWYRPDKCAQAGACWVVYASYKTAKAAADVALRAARAILNAGFGALQGAVTIAQRALDGVNRVLSAAQSVVNGFFRILAKAAGVLKKVLQIHYIKFSSTLTNRATALGFSFDITIFGFRLRSSATLSLNFDSIKAWLIRKLKYEIKRLVGISV